MLGAVSWRMPLLMAPVALGPHIFNGAQQACLLQLAEAGTLQRQVFILLLQSVERVVEKIRVFPVFGLLLITFKISV